MEVNPFVAVGIILLIAYVFFYLPAGYIRQVLVVLLFFIIGYALVMTVSEMPSFGALDTPANNMIPERYLSKAPEETGALNVIAAIITDYRAFDTLGEVVVLFVAIIAALSSLKAR